MRTPVRAARYSHIIFWHGTVFGTLQAHIHQPTAWQVPRTCAQPYHPGSASHSTRTGRYIKICSVAVLSVVTQPSSPDFFVSILNGSTAAAPHNSFETTVMADFLKPRFFKFPDNSATERNFPSPVDKHCNFDF